MERFPISEMIKHKTVYFFPEKFHSMLIEDIMQLNRVIISAVELTGISLFVPIEREKIKVIPDSDTEYHFSVLVTKPLTSTGKDPKYPQEVTFFVYDDMENNPYWHGYIYYTQEGKIGKGNIHFHIPFNCNYSREISALDISFKNMFEVSKIEKTYREHSKRVQIYPQL